MPRCALVPLIALALLVPAATASAAPVGAVSDIPGAGGCATNDGTVDAVPGICLADGSLDEPASPDSTAVAPDGRFVYVADEGGRVVMYARDAATGALSIPSGVRCWDDVGAGGCADYSGQIAGDGDSILITGDGRFLYATDESAHPGVLVFVARSRHRHPQPARRDRRVPERRRRRRGRARPVHRHSRGGRTERHPPESRRALRLRHRLRQLRDGADVRAEHHDRRAEPAAGPRRVHLQPRGQRGRPGHLPERATRQRRPGADDHPRRPARRRRRLQPGRRGGLRPRPGHRRAHRPRGHGELHHADRCGGDRARCLPRRTRARPGLPGRRRRRRTHALRVDRGAGRRDRAADRPRDRHALPAGGSRRLHHTDGRGRRRRDDLRRRPRASARATGWRSARPGTRCTGSDARAVSPSTASTRRPGSSHRSPPPSSASPRTARTRAASAGRASTARASAGRTASRSRRTARTPTSRTARSTPSAARSFPSARPSPPRRRSRRPSRSRWPAATPTATR